MKIPTGITPLDDLLSGGLPPGTLAVITVPPGTEYTPLIRAGRGRRSTVLFTTLRSSAVVERRLERREQSPNALTVADLDPGKAPSIIPDTFEELGETTDVYIDTIGPVEKSVPTDIYIDLLNYTALQVDRNESIGCIFGYRTGAEPYSRTVTLDVADFVVELDPSYETGTMNHRVTILKAGRTGLTESERTFEMGIRPESW